MARGTSICRTYMNWQSMFEKYCAAWSNHQEWQRMKRMNRRIAKRRMRQADRKLVEEWLLDESLAQIVI